VQENKERKQVEPVEKESEDKFRTLAEQSPNMIFINKRGRVVYANKKCEEVMGYKREDFYAPDFDFFILIAPEHQELIKSSFSKHMAGEETEPYEYALVTRDGARIEAIITTRLIDYEGERAILGTVTDITERVRTEEALQESEEKFRSLVENSHAGIFLLDETHRIIYVNDELSRISGRSSEEIVGQDFRAFLDDENQQFATDLYVRRQRGEEFPSRYEMEIIRKDGERRQAEITSTVIVDSAGNVRTVVQVLDITERKGTEGSLQTANERYEMATQAAKVGVWDWNMLLDEQPGFEVVGSITDATSLLALVKTAHPDLVLLDCDLPGGSHIEVLSRIQVAAPRPAIVALGKDADTKRAALATGIDAFVLKGDPPEELLNTLRRVHARQVPVSRSSS
jgi:PAS domain S-box-containing protein